jgi:hypothetical protein
MGKNWRQSELGIYFTQYIKPGIYGSTAKEYAEDLVIRKGGKPYIYKCKIHVKNPLILNSNGWYSSVTFIDKKIELILKDGWRLMVMIVLFRMILKTRKMKVYNGGIIF